MRIITNAGLHRGSALIDYAFSKDAEKLSLNSSDMIGAVAAYLNRGLFASDLVEKLTDRLGPEFASRAAATFKFFEVDTPDRSDGLWFQGAAYDDIRFVHPTLAHKFPRVNHAHRIVCER